MAPSLQVTSTLYFCHRWPVLFTSVTGDQYSLLLSQVTSTLYFSHRWPVLFTSVNECYIWVSLPFCVLHFPDAVLSTRKQNMGGVMLQILSSNKPEHSIYPGYIKLKTTTNSPNYYLPAIHGNILYNFELKLYIKRINTYF